MRYLIKKYLDNTVEPIDLEKDVAIEGDNVGLQSFVDIAASISH